MRNGVSQMLLYPLRFEPIYQYRLWGGRRLGDLLTAPLPSGPVGEAWILSDRDDHPSRVADGPLKGQTVGQLLAQFPQQLLGKLAGRFRRFPVFPSSAFALTVLLVYDMGRRLVPAKPWLPALIYATCPLAFGAASVVTTDTMLAFTEALRQRLRQPGWLWPAGLWPALWRRTAAAFCLWRRWRFVPRRDGSARHAGRSGALPRSAPERRGRRSASSSAWSTTRGASWHAARWASSG